MAPGTAFEFDVSAPAQETFAWLRGRGEKSGEVVSADAAATRFTARWRSRPLDGTSPVTLVFAVLPAGPHRSRVAVEVADGTQNPLAVIDDYAGPLGTRMVGLRAQPRSFFEPPRTPRDDVQLCAWGSAFAILLTVVAATRHIPEGEGTMSGREAIVEIVVPIVVVAFAVGLAGGVFLRRRGRWYELLALGLAVGWGVSFLVFDVWFNALDHATATQPESGSNAMGFGAGLAAIPEALILVCGVALGRLPAALASLVRAFRRRSGVTSSPGRAN